MRPIDMHCDTILRLMKDKENLELYENDFSIDIKKMKKGNSLAQFFAMFVYLKEEKDPMEMCLEMIDKFYTELEKNKDSISIATSYEDIIKNDREGKMSAVLTIEEGGTIKGKLENLRNFYRLGVRAITLTWNFPNEIGFPNTYYECKDEGLTNFGAEVVNEMNRLGMLIDVSHLSDQGFYNVARLSSKPFIASHSNARSVKEHSRNLNDDMIKTLSEKGGIMGICFEKYFLGESENAKVEDMIKHIKHIRNIGGIDVIALGSDFDGCSPNIEIDNIGEIEKLAYGLRDNKFTEDEIDKIFYKNALRVIKNVL
ncbi:dipeptidase [Proteiniborus sp. MB09-C3]|uniref:dipeptidase n=1 Tax=Proteiniborus sp. MB09-C3 TaxID=3050072 RepID=UPI0025531E09|nr:dipeptidase [Proteiniborus sp. MB09-C3]WIV11899.1 dipeptidase [Proteiniborus sp. MB09-C3]